MIYSFKQFLIILYNLIAYKNFNKIFNYYNMSMFKN